MLTGRHVGLRARFESDIAILHAGLYDDVDTSADADNRPWQPLPPTAAASPMRPHKKSDTASEFTVVSLDDDRVLGLCELWSIDRHNRRAHVGMALLPEERGRGYGVDVLRVLCRYGFSILGLHRLQVETNETNSAMLSVARRAGFTEEGRLRQSSWVLGRFVDAVVLGLLADEWVAEERAGAT